MSSKKQLGFIAKSVEHQSKEVMMRLCNALCETALTVLCTVLIINKTINKPSPDVPVHTDQCIWVSYYFYVKLQKETTYYNKGRKENFRKKQQKKKMYNVNLRIPTITIVVLYWHCNIQSL